jgi:hypothetical protein
MMKRFSKAIVCIILAFTMISSCCISFGAEDNKNVDEYFEILNDAEVLGFNEILMCSYNISDKYDGFVRYTDEDMKKDLIKYYAKNCIDEPKVVDATPNTTYRFFAGSDSSGSGSGNYATFDNTAGLYIKVRMKLSYYDYYFNEDGSHSDSTHNVTYTFQENQIDGKNQYFSTLIIVSGGAVNFVVPDKDGCVEFYVCTNIYNYTVTDFHTSFWYKLWNGSHYTYGGGGGINAANMDEFQKGAVLMDDFITISDATYIQRYISKMATMDVMQKFRADLDNNSQIDIMDATTLQRYLAKLKQ